MIDKNKCQHCLKELDNRIEVERSLCHKCFMEAEDVLSNIQVEEELEIRNYIER